MLLSEKFKQMTGERLLPQVSSLLDDMKVDQAIRDKVMDYARSKAASIAELADALGAPEDEPELYRSIGFLWLELKTEWVRYNQTMNYQCVRDGEAEPSVFIKGSVCADILTAVEGFMMPSEVEKLDAICVEPVAIGGPDVNGTQRFLKHCEGQIASVARIFSQASDAAASLSELRTAQSLPATRLDVLTKRYEKMLSDLAQEADRVLAVDFDTVWPILADCVEAMARDTGARITVAKAAAPDLKVDLRLARKLADVTRGAGAVLLAFAQEKPEARKAQGKAAHAEFSVAVVSGERSTELRLAFEGRGDLGRTLEANEEARGAWSTFLAELEVMGAAASVADTEGRSTEVIITIPRAGLASGEGFVVVEGRGSLVCFPSSALLDSPGEKAEATLDLRSDPAAPPATYRVTFASGRSVEVIGSGAPTRAQGVALPAAMVDASYEPTFAFAVLTPRGAAGLLDERAFQVLRSHIAPSAE